MKLRLIKSAMFLWLSCQLSYDTIFASSQVKTMKSPEELEAEIAARKQADNALRELNRELERRFEDRNAELKSINQTLRTEREWFRTTLSSIADAVITTDENSRVTMLNPVAESLTGWTSEDALGRPLDEVFHIVNEVTQKPVEDPAHRALREGVVVGLANHTILISKDGTKRPIDDSAAPIRLSDDEVKGCILVFRDVTERRNAERQLQEREERYRALVAASSQIVWTADTQGRVFEDSPSWREFTGQTLEEFLGWGWLDVVHPDDRERTNRVWQQAVATRSRYEIEYRLRSRDGSYRWTLARGVPVLKPDGSIREWVGANTDITDRKVLELHRARYAEMIETSSEFIGMCDMEMKPFFVNQAGLEMAGLKSLEEARQVSVMDFFFPEDRELLQTEFFDEVMRNGHGQIEIRFRHFQSGEPRWMIYYVNLLTDDEGQPEGFATVSKDITERKKSEDELRELAARLSEADRRKDTFLATLAHELRNPLAPITTGLKVMKLVSDDPVRLEETRQMLERQTKQLVVLVDDLLDVSRITSGKLQLRKARVELSDLLHNAVEAARPFIDDVDHDLSVEIPDGPIPLNADPHRLSQVFANLLNNSAKYTPRGGQVRLTAATDGNYVEVAVKDDGIGIPRERLDDIFNMFGQIEHPMDRSGSGLGIGLTLVKTLVELHDGTVRVESDGPGLGSTFVVRLPISEESRPEHVEPKRQSRPTSAISQRVLVVDDNEAAAKMMTIVIEMMGHDVRTAHNGDEAIDIAAEFQPEIVFMDIGMPLLNGYEAAREIRQQPWGQEMVLVAVTGWGQEEDKQKTKEAGFDHHLVKPADEATLREILETTC